MPFPTLVGLPFGSLKLKELTEFLLDLLSLRFEWISIDVIGFGIDEVNSSF